MRVIDVMSTPVHTVPASETATTAWELMRLRDTRHLVVEDAGHHVVGVLSASDLGGKSGASVRAAALVSDLMTEKVVVAHPETTVREAANMMRGHLVHCLPVVKGDKLMGIVTVIDLLELLGRGAERPTPLGTRAVLRSRGEKPQQTRTRAHKMTSHT
jgi:acetoin utilization protein AcuB